MSSGLRFPPGFTWGAATAAYQIEGAVHEGGRGPSIWDTFSRTPGTVAHGDTGDVATDHFHRYEDDVDLMASLGVGTYRFSVAWPRIQPSGRGPALREGLDFYSRLVDTLLDRGVTPAVTLYHWDLPQALEDEGGWAARDTAHRFADYAVLLHDALGDRVPLWSTLNEPWCSAMLGYAAGYHAPGRSEPAAALAATHHLLLGHGLATRAMQETARAGTQFSISLNLTTVLPGTQDQDDLAAARIVDGVHNRLYLDPVLRGSYPADVVEATRHVSDWSFVHDGDLAVTAAPIDVLGVNYYSPMRVAAAPGEPAPASFPGASGVRFLPPRGELTGMGWEVAPSCLADLLVRVTEDYGVPLLITENGMACDDKLDADGRVDDRDRIAFLHGHLTAAHEALERGADLRGYLAWSLLDNFEWALGYEKRFGLVYVDYETLARHPKRSAWWFRDLTRRNALPAADPSSL